MRTFLTTVQGLGIVLMVGFILIMAMPFFSIPGAFETFTVRSGSMEPALLTGSLIFVHSAEKYVVGDIITVRTADTKTVTHRIVEIVNTDIGPAYRTKGDNNEEADPVEVMPVDVIGKTYVIVPYVGYLVTYAQTRVGFFFLIVLPALLVILGEVRSIVREVRRLLRKKSESRRVDKELARNVVFTPSSVGAGMPRPQMPLPPQPRRKIV